MAGNGAAERARQAASLGTVWRRGERRRGVSYSKRLHFFPDVSREQSQWRC
jgi:hypothetical protein